MTTAESLRTPPPGTHCRVHLPSGGRWQWFEGTVLQIGHRSALVSVDHWGTITVRRDDIRTGITVPAKEPTP